MKTYQVVEAVIPIANDIYSESSLDLREIGNSSNRVICAPGEFTLGEILNEDEFRYENRGYENEDGSSSVSGVFAVRVKKRNVYRIPIIFQSVMTFDTEAFSLEEAVESSLREFLSIPDNNYLEDSFEVDEIVKDDYPDEDYDMNKILQRL